MNDKRPQTIQFFLPQGQLVEDGFTQGARWSRYWNTEPPYPRAA